MAGGLPAQASQLLQALWALPEWPPAPDYLCSRRPEGHRCGCRTGNRLEVLAGGSGACDCARQPRAEGCSLVGNAALLAARAQEAGGVQRLHVPRLAAGGQLVARGETDGAVRFVEVVEQADAGAAEHGGYAAAPNRHLTQFNARTQPALPWKEAMSESLQSRAQQLLALAEPLRLSAARDDDLAGRAWWHESEARLAEVLGCSLSDLARLGSSRALLREIDASTPSADLRVGGYGAAEFRLPLGDLSGERVFDWVVITRYRHPKTPRHEWQVERHRLATADELPQGMSAQFGWYWPNVTDYAIAAAFDRYATAVHYYVTSDGRLSWTGVGIALRTAPDALGVLCAEVRNLVNIAKQRAELFRLQVRPELLTRPDGEEVQRWGYRVLDPIGHVVRANSLAFSKPSRHERGYDSRAGAIQAGQVALRSVFPGSGWRHDRWEDVT